MRNNITTSLLSPISASARWSAWYNPLLVTAIVLVYFLARLPYMLSLPIFNDEANYQWRGLTFRDSLADSVAAGKVVYDLLLAMLVRMPGDPLLLSRICSVLFGLGTLTALLLIGRALRQPSVGILAGALYAGAPMVVLHERLGIPDSFLTCIGAFLLLTSIRFAQSPEPTKRQAFFLGILLGIASLIKVYGLFLIGIPVMAILWLSEHREDRWRRLSLLQVTLQVVLLWLSIFLFVGYGFFERHKMTFTSFEQRFDIFLQYTQIFGLVLLSYLPGLLLLPLGILAFLRPTLDTRWRVVLMLISSSIIFVTIFLILGTRIFPRYFMPIWPAVLIACAIGLTGLWQITGRKQWITRSICVAVVGITFAWNSHFTFHLMVSPHTAPLVAADRRGYIENWTAGFNLPALMDLIEHEAATHNSITVVNHDRGRLIRTAARLHFHTNPNVILKSIEMTSDSAAEQLQQLAITQPTYIVLDGESYDLLNIPQRFPNADIVQFFEHPSGPMRFYLLRYPASQDSM